MVIKSASFGATHEGLNPSSTTKPCVDFEVIQLLSALFSQL